MIDALSIDRFHDLVASYGADPDRWPAELRGNAVSCLVESEAARAAWCEAAELDADLDRVAGLDTSPDLVQAVLAIADTPDKPISAPASAIMRHVLPYAAAAAIALVIGLSVPSPLRDTTVAAPQAEIVLSDPEALDESSDSDDGLTTLALVDTTAFADDEISAGDALSDDSPLSQLPLL